MANFYIKTLGIVLAILLSSFLKYISPGVADIFASFGLDPVPRRQRPAQGVGIAGFLGEFRRLVTSETLKMLGHEQFLWLGSFSPAEDQWLLLSKGTIYFPPSFTCLPSSLPLPSFLGVSSFAESAAAPMTMRSLGAAGGDHFLHP